MTWSQDMDSDVSEIEQGRLAIVLKLGGHLEVVLCSTL